MAIPSRQIGWSTKSNLLWQISKQLENLIRVTYNNGTTTTSTTSSSTTSTTSTTSSTTSTTTTVTPTTTTTTTTTNPFQPISLYSNGTLCGASKDWSQETPAQVKCDWIEVFAGGSPGYSGSQFLYYISAGFNVGTQLYSESPGNPPVTFSGTYIYYLSGSYLDAKVFTLTTGIISAIYNLGDLPVCGPYVCPTNITTEGSDPIITEDGNNLIMNYPLPTSEIITEAGDFVITENGDNLTTQ